jgi:Fe-S-cluster containining protein
MPERDVSESTDPTADLAGAGAADAPVAESFDCLSCGACCAPRANWRVYVAVDDAERQRLPEKYALRVLNGELRTHPRRDGVRCVALVGTLGISVRCDIHPVRPAVCRAFAAGGRECREARAEVLGWR